MGAAGSSAEGGSPDAVRSGFGLGLCVSTMAKGGRCCGESDALEGGQSPCARDASATIEEDVDWPVAQPALVGKAEDKPYMCLYMAEPDKGGLRRTHQVWPEGAIFKGECRADCEFPHGRGQLRQATGTLYTGQWAHGFTEGLGVCLSTDLSKYEGEWQDNVQHGLGVETWQSGERYEGQFFASAKTGVGKFSWADGRTYEGAFQSGTLHGPGVYTWPDGRIFKGHFACNRMHGMGCFAWPDGRSYAGGYVNDAKEGFGVFTWPDGRRYEGGWKNGTLHGHGTTTQADGKRLESIFEGGALAKQEGQPKAGESPEASAQRIVASKTNV